MSEHVRGPARRRQSQRLDHDFYDDFYDDTLGGRALVAGLFAVLLFWAQGFGVILGSAAIVLGAAGLVSGRKNTTRIWRAVAGLILGLITLPLAIWLLVTIDYTGFGE